MDPDINLLNQRQLAAETLQLCAMDDPPYVEIMECAERLADLVQALDAWILRGGFKPKDWTK